MELEKVTNLLNDLLTPASKLDKVGLTDISLVDILNGIIENFEQKNPNFIQIINISNKDSQDKLWKFGLLCLYIMQYLNEANFEYSKNGCYLSINQERQVSTCCQLIVCFCIHYNLEENIGVSIDRLSKFGVNISKKRVEVDEKLRNERLIFSLRILNKIRLNQREHVNLLKSYFYPKYLHDVICALIQVTYSPNSFKFENRDEFINWVESDLFNETDGANIVSSLLMAQSSSTIKMRNNPWFINVIGRILTKCLLRPNSVMSVIKAVLTELNALSTVELASDWKKCDIVARILAQCPREVSIQEYFEIVSPQILSLFFNPEPRFAKHFYRVAGSIYSMFSQRWPDLSRSHLTQNIIAPLYSFDIEQQKNINLDAKSFRACLNSLHLIYTAATEPNWSTINQLPGDLIKILFQIYILVYKKINCDKTRNKIEDILKTYIRMMPSNLIEDFLNNLLLETLIDSCNNKILYSENFHFESYDDDMDGEQLIINFNSILNEENKEITLEMVETRCQALVNLIKSLNDTQLEIEFLLRIFSNISKEIVEQNDIKKKNQNDRATDNTLLIIEQNLESKSKNINLKIIYFTLLSIQFEKIDPQLIVDKYDRIIKFCKLILENLMPFLREENDQNLLNEQNELIHLILSIISVFTTGLIELEHSVKTDLQQLIPNLVELQKMYRNSDIGDMAESLHISVATYCGIKTINSKNSSDTKSSHRVLIEEIDEENVDISNQDEYSLALKDINDPLIPVKAHGLVSMRKLIEKKHPKCIENKVKLIDVYIRNLKNEDSYVYLAAIIGLISLVDSDPDRVLNVLIEQFMSSQNSAKLDIDNRLKVGEVLTKTVKNFGELVPKYGPRLLNTFLIGAKHENEFIRSSSLSNLGEVCKLLNYSLNQNIYEIVNCLSSLLDTDSSNQVKRSAILVLRMIIEGLQKDNFLIILGSSIVPLYKLLIKIKSSTNDEIISLNCQLTSEYINQMMKESMFPAQTLQKEIKVLRP